MSSRVVYTCDRCGKESEDKDFLRQVRAGIVRKVFEGYSETGNIQFDTCLMADWCDDCRLACHFYTNAELEELKKKGLPIPEQPTLEMQLRELIESIVDERMEDNGA